MNRALASQYRVEAGAPVLNECVAAPSVSPRRRVLHVFYRLGPGGAELRTLEALRAIGSDTRVETHVLVHSGEAGELDEEFRRAGATLHHIRLTAATLAPRFVRLLRVEQIDIVHSHVQYFSGWLLMLARFAGVRQRFAHLWITRNEPSRSPFRLLHRRLGRMLLGHYATRIFAVGQDTMDIAFGPSDDRCRVIYGGIEGHGQPAASLERTRHEGRAEFGIPAHVPLLIHAGRFGPAKNHLRIVSIFAELARRDPAVRLLFVGIGDAAIENSVRERLAQLGLSARVTFAGLRSDVPRLLAAADVLLFPSRREGLPGVVLEALAVGTPCVASAIPGTREIGRHLDALCLLDLQVSDSRWASAVEEAMIDRSLATRVERTRLFSAAPFSSRAAAAALLEEWTRS